MYILSGTLHPLALHTLTAATATVASSAILVGSDPHPLSRPRSFMAAFAPGDFRSLGDSSTYGIVCTFADLALSYHSSLSQRRADLLT